MAYRIFDSGSIPDVRNGSERNIDFTKGEVTALQTDKIGFDSSQLLTNFYSRGGNLVLRGGFSKLMGNENLIDIFINEGATNDLVGAIKTSGTTKISKIDRTSGSLTDWITGMVGETETDMSTLRGILYVVNGTDTDIHYYDGTTAATLAFDYGTGAVAAKLCAATEDRLWVCENGDIEVLAFSQAKGTGVAGGFNPGASTDIDRAGIANSQINKFTALKPVGKYVVACSTNRTEIHRIPDFAKSGASTFPANVTTLLYSYDGIGVKDKESIVAVEDFIYIKTNDGNLTRIHASTGNKKSFKNETRFFEETDWNSCKMVFHQGLRLIYFSGKELADDDIVGVFNIDETSFNRYDNLLPARFTGDDENVYFMRASGDVFEAFGDSTLDNGLKIEFDMLSQATYSDNMFYYKKMLEVFVHAIVFSDTTIKVDIITDRGIDSDISPAKSFNLEFKYTPVVFSGNPQSYNQGIFGGSQIRYNSGEGTESMENNTKINTLYERLEIRLSGKTGDKLEIKGLGYQYQQTQRKIKTLKFD